MSFAAVSSMLMMQDGCTPCSATWYIKRNRSLSTSTSLRSVVFLVPPDAARYLKPAQRRKCRIHRLPNLRVMPRCSATLLKMGCITHAEIGACLANTVALLSQNGNDHIASNSRFAPFLLVLLQPSSQCPRRQPRSENMRQPCRQMVHNRLVVPSLQVA